MHRVGNIVSLCTSTNIWALASCYHTDNADSFITEPECMDGSLQLAGGSSQNNGAVEFCADGVWGGVCSSGWDHENAAVVCRQLALPINS